jgi:hypothetical protein
MKEFNKIWIAFMLVAICATTNVFAEAWWELSPPKIISPAANTHFEIDEMINHCWELNPNAPTELVSHYEIMFANAPPNTIDLFVPDSLCDWNFIRECNETCYQASHQENHEPVYWKVRVVFTNGHVSNWAIGYYLVGDIAGNEPPPTINYPLFINHECNPAEVYHEWTVVPGADYYEVYFAQAWCNILYLLEDCEIHYNRATAATSFWLGHDCIHLPIYLLVRAVFPDSSKGNWAVSYYNMYNSCLVCEGCIEVGTEKSSWGKIKAIYK